MPRPKDRNEARGSVQPTWVTHCVYHIPRRQKLVIVDRNCCSVIIDRLASLAGWLVHVLLPDPSPTSVPTFSLLALLLVTGGGGGGYRRGS
ncbi:hypothetical protein ElyMa_002812600 [Elysia marginata]|uniref:Uncharacterized protein n=1 Tax=Elysia marginata TaxID=1093978 RepID=A0AAV4HQD1_9GAST|nr:hypothetical protein ElyMa_002812600 [Elysia marginata]